MYQVMYIYISDAKVTHFDLVQDKKPNFRTIVQVDPQREFSPFRGSYNRITVKQRRPDLHCMVRGILSRLSASLDLLL